jgi:hypothetical protein
MTSCPDCHEDLLDEGFGYWCARCQRAVSPAEVRNGPADD